MGVVRLLMAAVSDFRRENAMDMGSALASYTARSFSPLLVILLFVAGLIGGDMQNHC